MADATEQAPHRLPQGDLRLLETVGAQRLLGLAVPARVAYLASDGTPRVVPTWFHWTGEELVMATFLAAPHIRHPAARLRAWRRHPRVAVVIDTDELPPSVLTPRGDVALTEHAGVVTEYALAAHRYMALRRRRSICPAWTTRSPRWSGSVSDLRGSAYWTSRRDSRAAWCDWPCYRPAYPRAWQTPPLRWTDANPSIQRTVIGGLFPDGPMLDTQVRHREVPGVACGQARVNADGRCRDQAVGLMQRNALSRKLSPPLAREFPLPATEWRDAQAAQQPDG